MIPNWTELIIIGHLSQSDAEIIPKSFQSDPHLFPKWFPTYQIVVLKYPSHTPYIPFLYHLDIPRVASIPLTYCLHIHHASCFDFDHPKHFYLKNPLWARFTAKSNITNTRVSTVRFLLPPCISKTFLVFVPSSLHLRILIFVGLCSHGFPTVFSSRWCLPRIFNRNRLLCFRDF